MAFDNAYPNRKDWRREYHGMAERVDRSCRPNGSDSWDRSNRTIREQKEAARVADDLRTFERGE